MSSCRGRENACYGALLAACSALVGYFSLTSGARWPVLMLSVLVLWTLAPSRTAAFWVAGDTLSEKGKIVQRHLIVRA